MTKFLLTLIGISALIFLIANDTWRVTLDTSDYEISTSFILCLTGIFLCWYLLSLLLKPITWWGRFQNWRREKKQEQKDCFLLKLLTTIISHETLKQQELVREAKSLYGAKSQELLLISALFQPQQEIFQELYLNSQTKLAGLFGLVQEAEKLGNFEEMASLLQQVPSSQQRTPWVQQAKMRLALNRNDWSEALRLLEESKKYLPKEKFLSHKACLLLKLGQVKKAYHLMPSHVAIALAYAKINPKKAGKVLSNAWHKNPSWPIYLAYKETLKKLPNKKRLKAILTLTRNTRDERYSLLAQADMDMDLGNWARAKEDLENYLQNYPLTHQVAEMMATVERMGWHHEDIAKEWENKLVESEDDSLWICGNCAHSVSDWQILCPHCNGFDTLYYK